MFNAQDKALINFIFEAQARAEKIISDSFSSKEINVLLQDFIHIGDQAKILYNESTSQGADTVFIKRQFEKNKTKLKEAEKKIIQMNSVMLPKIAEQFKLMLSEMQNLSDLAQKIEKEEARKGILKSVLSLKESIQNTVKLFHFE